MLKRSTAAHDLVVDLRELRQADLESRIERDESRGESRGDWRVFAICTAIALLDGFDIQTMGVAAPALTRAWGVAPAAMSTVFAAAPAGMLAGALVMGRLADWYGRRCPIIAATLLFAAGTGLTAFAPNLTALAAIRFLTGLGLGGVLPNLVSLVTESAPARLRGRLTTLTFSTLPLGAMVAALLARYLIPAFGWQSLFYAGAAAPLIVAIVALFQLPESTGFRARGNARAADPVPVRRIDPVSPIAPGALTTILLVLVTALNLFMLYFTLNWLPTMLTLAGVPAERALLATVLLNTSGCFGSIVWGFLIDRTSAPAVMAGAGVLASAGMALLSVAHAHPALLVLSLVVAGTAVLGGVPGLYAVIASCYPTPMRSTGVGNVLGAGRIGSVLGPAAGGVLLNRGWPVPDIFLAVGALGLVWAFALWRLRSSRSGFSRTACETSS